MLRFPQQYFAGRLAGLCHDIANTVLVAAECSGYPATYDGVTILPQNWFKPRPYICAACNRPIASYELHPAAKCPGCGSVEIEVSEEGVTELVDAPAFQRALTADPPRHGRAAGERGMEA